MLRKRTWFLLLIALGLRLLLQGWDAGVVSTTVHPDERQVGFVTERLDGWFSNPEFFAYGSLHFQAVHATTMVLAKGEHLRGLVVSGRVLSLLSSMLALILGWILAHRAWGRRTGELFLILVAWVPLDLQQSHFATVEAHHTAWIMLALAACYWLASGGRAAAAAGAGAAVGASLAVKVASLALGLPLAMALLLVARRRGLVDATRLGAVAVAVGGFAFWLCQPWAFTGARPPLAPMLAAALGAVLLHLSATRPGKQRRLLIGFAFLAAVFVLFQVAALTGFGSGTAPGRFIATTLVGGGLNPAYLAGVGEQVRMVMGEADLPYVRVFVNTLPVLYPLRELALWGWGPLLLLTVLVAAAAGLRVLGSRWRRWISGRWNNSTILLLIVLAWLVPMSVRLSTLYVKYLRYWEPLVVPAALLAAWWLSRLPGGYRRRAVLTVAAGTIVWGLAFMWAFVEPHPHGTATKWLQPMLESGQTVAFESWDETIGLHLREGSVTTYSLPSYDLPDDDEKVLRWCEDLARADWVVLTSNRVTRTIFANPERFPKTGRLYRLLFAGEAGFELLTRARRGPRLFGLRWPVQRADESFVNYDFPQVLIFRRTTQIDPELLAERVERPLPNLGMLDALDFERRVVEEVPAIPPVPTGLRQVIDLGLWLFVFAGLAASSWFLLLPVVGKWPDAGVGLSIATGWIVPSWLMWFGNELGMWPTGPSTASWTFILVLSAGSLALTARWEEAVSILVRRRRNIMMVVSVALSVGLLFLLVRASNPAIFWGEKPMDFSFLNSFLRASSWPTGEPWMAGMPLHYYYFGEVLAAFPILVTGCSAAVGYNLMSATIPALSAAALAGLGLLFARRWRWRAAILLPVLVLLSGNLAWPWLVGHLRHGKWFDLWWATSRVLPSPVIDEYPLWTTLFADLHGHFIALPVLIAGLIWGWVCVEKRDGTWVIAAILCGICTAALVATNPWDLFVFSGTLGVGTLVAARRRLPGIQHLVVAAAVSLIAAAPFVVELLASLSAGAGERGLFLTRHDFAPAWAVLRHFGLFLIPLAMAAVLALGRRSWMVVPTAGAGIIAGLWMNSSAAAFALATAALFATVMVTTRDRMTRFGWSLGAFAVLAVAACERWTLIDRMNTVFKVYNGVWLLLAAALTLVLLRTRGRRRILVIGAWVPLQIVAMVNLPLGVAQGWLQPRVVSPRPTLDGQAFLRFRYPETWFLAHALQGAARPEEAVAEAAGPYYSQHTRITMHTGQPTVVGWEWHLKQRGQDPIEIAARFTDLQTLYAGRDARARRAVLDRYDVGWVVVGDLERKRYGLASGDPLRGIPGLVKIAEQGEAAIYRVMPADNMATGTIEPVVELPPGAHFLGELPRIDRPALSSLIRNSTGAVVVMSNGEVAELDSEATLTVSHPHPGCETRSAVRHENQLWAICSDGAVMQLRDQQWSQTTRIQGASFLTADDALWAWGHGGIWRYDNRAWRPVSTESIVAAAANGPWLAWSNGLNVWVGRGGLNPRTVNGRLDGIKEIAWQGSNLWAADASGLHRSGGAVLPWRRVLASDEAVLELAGGPDSLWIVRPDGLIIEWPLASCPPPWSAAESSEDSGGLKEPRGIAVSRDGWFVVTDTLNHRIRWYSENGLCLDDFGSEGSADGNFHEPSGLALSRDGVLAIADTWNGRIQIMDPSGKIETIGRSLFGPRGLLWLGDGSLVAADTGNRKLYRYTPPDWQQQDLIADLPAPVVGITQVGGLIAAALPADGGIVLVDLADGRIVRRLEVPAWSGRTQQEGYLALLPSGRLAASAPKTGELWSIDPTGSDPPELLQRDLPGLTAITLLPDGNILGSLTWEHRLVRIELDE